MKNKEIVKNAPGHVKRLSLKTEFLPEKFTKVTTSKEVYDFVINHFDKDTISLYEEFHLVLVNRANYITGIAKISQGGFNGTVADPKIILIYALLHGASAIILTHNHPSGNKTPSEQDLKLTKNIREGAKMLDITVLDHIIVTPDDNQYYSFAEEGTL